MARRLGVAFTLLVVAATWSCSQGGGSSGGGSSASTSPAAAVPRRRAPPAANPVYSGDIVLNYTLTDPASAPGAIVADFSLDSGQTWTNAALSG